MRASHGDLGRTRDRPIVEVRTRRELNNLRFVYHDFHYYSNYRIKIGNSMES